VWQLSQDARALDFDAMCTIAVGYRLYLSHLLRTHMRLATGLSKDDSRDRNILQIAIFEQFKRFEINATLNMKTAQVTLGRSIDSGSVWRIICCSSGCVDYQYLNWVYKRCHAWNLEQIIQSCRVDSPSVGSLDSKSSLGLSMWELYLIYNLRGHGISPVHDWWFGPY
jgi:hypothetical protein